MLTKPALLEISGIDGLLQYLNKVTQEINHPGQTCCNLAASLSRIEAAGKALNEPQPKQKRRTKT